MTPERTLGQAAWPYETSQLREKLVQLMDQQRIWADFLVAGAITVMRNFLQHQADPERSERALDRNRDMIHEFEAMKAMPMAERPDQLTDEAIDRLMEPARKTIENADAAAAAVEETLQALEELVSQQFPPDYWGLYLLSRLGQ